MLCLLKRAVVMALCLICPLLAMTATAASTNGPATASQSVAPSSVAVADADGHLSAAGPVCVTDDTGTPICLPAPARAVIPLYASFGEILQAMGFDGVVAATLTDPTPHVPRVGTHIRPNLELITAAAPDLVIQSGGRAEALEGVAALRRLGVTVAVFNLGSFDELFRAVERLGVLTGRERAAGELANGMRARLDAVSAAVAGRRTNPSVLFELRYPNFIAAGQDAMVSDVIRLAGGKNAVDLPGRIVRMGEEAILALDPDAFLMQVGPMNKNPQPVSDRPRLGTLRAVRNGRVLLVPEDTFTRPGPRNIDAVEALARWLHPDLFPAQGPASE